MTPLAQFGLSVNIPKMKADLALRHSVHQWFFESSLHDSGYVADTVQALTDRDYTYEKDGALWLKTSDILAAQLRREGKTTRLSKAWPEGRRAAPRQRVPIPTSLPILPITATNSPSAALTRSSTSGAPTTTAMYRLKGAMDALPGWPAPVGHRADAAGETVATARPSVCPSAPARPSVSPTCWTRSPVDACRWFFNAKPETQMEFDLGLAVREDSENPVYYVQYACARICTW